jgi:hypothetical protein
MVVSAGLIKLGPAMRFDPIVAGSAHGPWCGHMVHDIS